MLGQHPPPPDKVAESKAFSLTPAPSSGLCNYKTASRSDSQRSGCMCAGRQLTCSGSRLIVMILGVPGGCRMSTGVGR
jgi:hypothetical protein